jgi:hypothetical protein
MGTIQLRVVSVGLFYLFIFLSGVWLSHSGKPLNVIVLTIHKLISLATLVFLVIIIYQINQVVKLSPIELIAGVVAGLFFLGAIISGALLSTSKPKPAAILTIHQITSSLAVLSTAVTLYLLLSYVEIPPNALPARKWVGVTFLPRLFISTLIGYDLHLRSEYFIE